MVLVKVIGQSYWRILKKEMASMKGRKKHHKEKAIESYRAMAGRKR